MANVTGSIGDQHVVLENAATEATLKALLQAFLAKNAGDASTLKKIAEKVNLNTEEVEEQLEDLGEEAEKTGTEFKRTTEDISRSRKGFINAFDSYTKEFTAGTAKASQLFEALGQFNNTFGVFATITAKLLAIQEQYLITYQQISGAGANFAGSLTDMKTASLESYLSLEQFGRIVTENSAAFAKMGPSVDGGVRAFTKLSHELINGETGKSLLGLGYTTEELNQQMVDYIANTGGRTREELANTKEISNSTKEYLTELDALSTITGKSRKEQEAAAKEAAANQAVQAKLQTMSEEERKKYEIARAEAFARGGKGAEEALQSALLGFPPMTKAAQEYTAVAGNMNDVTMEQAKAITDSTKSVKDMKNGAAAYNEAAIKDKKNLGTAGDAMIMRGGTMASTAASIYQTANRAVAQGAETTAKSLKQVTDVSDEQAKRAESQAADAAESSKAMQDLAANLNTFLNPIIKYGAGAINALISGFNKLPHWLQLTVEGLAAAYLAIRGYKAMVGVGNAAGGVMSRMMGGGGGGASGVLGEVEKAGPGTGGVLQSLAGGLKSFANPQILLGATILAGSIAIIITGIGAGIAAASWLMGKALPTLAEGLSKFANINGDNLKKTGAGLGVLGLGLMSFIPFGIAGMPAVLAVNLMANGLEKMAAVDPSKLERVAGAMKSIKDNTPGIGASISAGIFGLVSKVTGGGAATATPATATAGIDVSQNSLYNAVKELNKTSSSMLDALNEIAGHSKRTGDAVKRLNNNNWAN